jgi:hypothetical protein
MQAPRGHARGHSGGKGKGKEHDPEDEPSSPEGSEEVPDVFSYGRLFALDHCRQHGTVYAFQIADAEVERYSVRISTAVAGKPTCSCDEIGTCRHVLWLLGQLARTNTDVVEGVDVDPYEQISNMGLNNVCDELHWELREGTDSDSEETLWQLKKAYVSSKLGRQTRGMARERMKVVRDIMATLSLKVTDDYRVDIFEGEEISMDDNIFVPQDLEATLARLLVLDDDIFYQFKALVPRNVRASEYFRKLDLKAQNACLLLDKYCELGPEEGQHDIIWCAQTLVDIVNTISVNVTERQPLSPSSREEAAKALVSILGMVVKQRNCDVYQDLNWPRRRIHGEPTTDRNLYARLIGTTSPANPAGGAFVVKALQELPEAQRFVEELEEILHLLGTIGWGPAPRAYRDRLSEFIGRLKSVGSELPGPSAAAQKRSASSIERKAKRMK